MSKKKRIEMLSSSYSSLITKGMSDKTHFIANELSKIKVLDKDNTLLHKEGEHVFAVIGELEKVNSFAHPIISNKDVYIDARAFLNKQGKLKDVQDFTFLVNRAKIELSWSDDPDGFSGHVGILVDLFASWFSNSLTIKSDLPLEVSTNFKILAATYYLGLLHRPEEMSNEDISIRLLRLLPRILRVAAPLITRIMDTHSGMLESLYDHSLSDGYNSKLEELSRYLDIVSNEEYGINISTIFNVLSRGAFVGSNSPEITGIALEHIPTFAMIAYIVSLKGIQGRTSIGRTFDGIKRKHDVESFIDFIERLIS